LFCTCKSCKLRQNQYEQLASSLFVRPEDLLDIRLRCFKLSYEYSADFPRTKYTFRIGLARPHTCAANQNIRRIPCTPLPRYGISSCPTHPSRTRSKSIYQSSTILPFLQSNTGFQSLLLRDQSLDEFHRRFSLPPPPLPTFCEFDVFGTYASRFALVLC
jgi:hypothetical protein